MAARTTNWLRRYDAMCNSAASSVISTYSTSFNLSSRLLPARERRDIHNLYAVVRIADEIVDGTAEQAGAMELAAVLDAYERQVLAAPDSRFHTDPVMHAYARTARRCEFDNELLKAFFASMRRDLASQRYSQPELEDYVYGSAEVIGLLCLDVFLADKTVDPAQRITMENGAKRLGAAFQKVNFLRDIAEDTHDLGRVYFATHGILDDAAKAEIVAEIRGDLAAAHEAIGLLPLSARAAVTAAANLFIELTDMIDAMPAERLSTTRVSVPTHRKALITAQAVARAIGGKQK
ncbi:phytoene/squalene synthase family protein [uncultured Corynebacterium sp.]|uniref:phytoene/squalene synthase family protein n=1 Tax=uncultured Corynebacterium sp. TaxID=159447 RepID=UPI00345B5D45